MLPDAIKNPLIYLNFAIHCYETGRVEQSQLNLGNFAKMTEQMKVRIEVKILRILRMMKETIQLFYLQIVKAFEKLSIELSKNDEIENAHQSNEDDSAENLDKDEVEDPIDDENIQENLV